jgi:hypothetical protein
MYIRQNLSVPFSEHKNTNFREAETIGVNGRKIFTLKTNLINLSIRHVYTYFSTVSDGGIVRM